MENNVALELHPKPICGRFYNVAVDKTPAKVPPTVSSPHKLVVKPAVAALGAAPPAPAEDAIKCERCGADMYCMHAVWRCPSCRFKSDCCGW